MSEYQQERKGFWHAPDGPMTTEAIALENWARAAHDVLEETATSYHGVIRESELAERLQDDTGIRTTRPPDRWLPKVLQPLAHLHFRDGYPPLTALVVDGHGWVGERYDDVLRANEENPISDPAARERHASRSRLACYQWAGSAPEDGGLPAEVLSTTRSRAPRSTTAAGARAPKAPRAPREPKVTAPKRVAASDRPITVCPNCFMAIPATGLCDNCD
ncbi:hypothetical protein [Nocardioides sp.]|uniref:hypothetical protein n=1 Tax=Nocardioides sp. TaxID=35761 RepID=UPI0027195EA1|nr:hypothetical protein [Nocardioides sp.]MDO9456761.1 hypothetical protein [Nocardioides sp.]